MGGLLRTFRTCGMLLGLATLGLVIVSKDFRLLGGGAMYLVNASILALLLFSPLKDEPSGASTGLTVDQLRMVAVLSVEFTVLGGMALLCHGASFPFASVVVVALTAIFIGFLYPLITRAQKLTRPDRKRTGGYFTKPLSLTLVFVGVASVAGVLYLLFSLEAARRGISSTKTVQVGIAFVMFATLITFRLTFNASRIRSVGRAFLTGWCVLLGITTLMVFVGDLTTSNGWYFALLSLVSVSGLTASVLSNWPSLQSNEVPTNQWT